VVSSVVVKASIDNHIDIEDGISVRMLVTAIGGAHDVKKFK
jgi:hypothetical protein